jgi:hypothetical protein
VWDLATVPDIGGLQLPTLYRQVRRGGVRVATSVEFNQSGHKDALSGRVGNAK